MERYEIVKDLGSGASGIARLVRDKCTGEHLAVKFIERGKKVDLLILYLLHLDLNFPFLFFSVFNFLGYGIGFLPNISVVLQIGEHVQGEIMNHRSLKHPNIVQFKEVSNYMSTGCIYICSSRPNTIMT